MEVSEIKRYIYTNFKANIFDVGEDILAKYDFYYKQQFPAYFMSNEENLFS